MKIYVVTSGCYSDYNIEAVFSTETIAQSYIDKGIAFGADKKSIEEFELDIPPEQWVVTRVTMMRNGIVIDITKIYNGRCGLWWLGETRDALTWGVGTEDAERAIKVVNEKRTQIVALNLWPETELQHADRQELYDRIRELVK